MDADTTKIAKEVVQNIIKSKKNLRMYPENNPIYIKTVDTAYDTFNDILDYRDEISFKIKQLEIIHDGEQVYYKPDKDDNLALFFFKDGIRELTFKNGLTKEELEDFLKIIMIDFDTEVEDDDVVTLMWERDFQNISYIVDEAFLTDDENYEERAVQQVKERAAEEDDLMKAYSEVSGAEDITYIPVVPLNDEDIAKLQEELDKDTGYYIDKLTDLLFEMLYLSEKKQEFQDLVAFFRSAIDYSLMNNYIELALNIIRRTHQLLNADQPVDLHKPYLTMILSYINSDRVIKLLGELLDSRTEDDEEIASELFPLMDSTAIPALIKTLGELETIHARKIIINALIILGKKDIVSVAKGLNDKRWFVVRNMIYVLRNIRDKRAVEYLVKKLRHNDIRVRKEVIKALGDLGGAEVVNSLRIYINDSDPAVRGLTAKALAQTGSPFAKRVLIDEISSSSFRNKDYGEKKEFFESIALWKERDVIGFLIKILKKKPFLRRGKINENRACAAYALGLIGHKDTLEILEKFKGLKNNLIRESVTMAIKRIEHGSTTQRAQ
jgi:HEAT repeat protein